MAVCGSNAVKICGVEGKHRFFPLHCVATDSVCSLLILRKCLMNHFYISNLTLVS